MTHTCPPIRRVTTIACKLAAAVLSAIAIAAMPAGGQEQPGLQRFSVRLRGHTFAVWGRLPAAPRCAVVLLHGRTWSSLPAFDLQVPGMNRSVLASLAARNIAAYALDQRGYGQTPRDRSGWITPRQAAEDAAGILEWVAARHPSLPRPALLGWSLGGMTAHLVAARSPRLLSALILCGYAVDPDARLVPLGDPRVPPRAKNTRSAAAADFISPRVTHPSVVQAFVDAAIQADPIHADWKNEEQFLCDSSRITVPTILIYGETDPNVEGGSLKQFYARLGTREKQVVPLPGADHCAHLEDTHDAWVAAIAGFLERPGVLNR
jgi:alpha-beta hydrolase superfamily lysophospholipase